MFKKIVLPFFFLLAVSPIFAAIEVRDTTHLPECDTIIDKNGVIAPVKILKVSLSFITYKRCSDNAKRTYIIEVNKVQDIKSKKFTLPKPIDVFNKAKKAWRFAAIYAILFFASLLSLIPLFQEEDSGKGSILLIIPVLVLFLSPFIIIGSLINSFSALLIAKKAGDKKAQNLAKRGIFFSILPFLVIAILRFL
jgi:hypothetical protein